MLNHMHKKWRYRSLLLGIFTAAVGWPSARSADRTISVGESEAVEIGAEAYNLRLPACHDWRLTRRVMTNVVRPDGQHAPMGQFGLMRRVIPPQPFTMSPLLLLTRFIRRVVGSFQ